MLLHQINKVNILTSTVITLPCGRGRPERVSRLQNKSDCTQPPPPQHGHTAATSSRTRLHPHQSPRNPNIQMSISPSSHKSILRHIWTCIPPQARSSLHQSNNESVHTYILQSMDPVHVLPTKQQTNEPTKQPQSTPRTISYFPPRHPSLSLQAFSRTMKHERYTSKPARVPPSVRTDMYFC